MKIPAGTQTGKTFRWRKGMPSLRGYRQGDQLVKVFVETPTRLCTPARLLEEFAKISGESPSPYQFIFRQGEAGFGG